LCSLLIPLPLRSTLFPYTTLFRSGIRLHARRLAHVAELSTHVVKRSRRAWTEHGVKGIGFEGVHAAEERIDNQPARHAQEDNIAQCVPVAKARLQRHYQ